MQKSKVTSIRDPRHTLSLFTVLLLAPLAVRSAEIPQMLVRPDLLALRPAGQP